MTAATLVGAVCVMTDALPVRAEASLEALPRGSVTEAAHRIDVRLEGFTARVESRQTIVNGDDVPREAQYRFELPGAAAITGLTVTIADRRAAGIAVDERAAIDRIDDPDAFDGRADAGLLRLTARGSGTARYALRLGAIPSGETATVAIEWQVPLRYDAGRVSLRIPDRGRAPELVRERVTVRARPPRGGRLTSGVHAPGARVRTSGKVHRFAAPVGSDVVVEAAVSLSRSPLHAEFATAPLDDDFGAFAVALAAAPAAGDTLLDHERIVVLVDRSRSMSEDGVKAAGRAVDALLNAAPGGSRIEVIAFDRTPHRVFGALRGNDAEARKEIAEQLRPGALENGSDLGSALEVAGRVALEDLGDEPAPGFERGDEAPNLIVIVSDGLVPLDLSPEQAANLLGARARSRSRIVNVALVPDAAPLPDTTAGPAAKLAARTGGRSVALRHGEVLSGAAELAAAIRRPAPITDVELDADGTELRGSTIPALPVGRGHVAVGFYRGAPPGALRVTARRGALEIEVSGRRSRTLGKRAASLALASASAEDFLDSTRDRARAGGEDELVVAERALREAAADAGVVSRRTSLVALDRRDRLSRDRRRMIERWGPSMFQRLPARPARDIPIPRYRDQLAPPDESSRPPRRRTGALDRDIIERLIQTYVLPRARACYEQALRTDPDLQAAGTLVLELTRGEVQAVGLRQSTLPGSLADCVIEAGYSASVPTVAQGADPEAIGVARYPLRFRPAQGGRVEQGSVPDPDEELELDFDEPLGGAVRD